MSLGHKIKMMSLVSLISSNTSDNYFSNRSMWQKCCTTWKSEDASLVVKIAINKQITVNYQQSHSTWLVLVSYVCPDISQMPLIYLSIYLFVYRSIYSSISQTIRLPINLSIYLSEGVEFKFEIRFYSPPLVFLDMNSVHFMHIRYIKACMNSGLILILWDLWLMF